MRCCHFAILFTNNIAHFILSIYVVFACLSLTCRTQAHRYILRNIKTERRKTANSPPRPGSTVRQFDCISNSQRIRFSSLVIVGHDSSVYLTCSYYVVKTNSYKEIDHAKETHKYQIMRSTCVRVVVCISLDLICCCCFFLIFFFENALCVVYWTHFICVKSVTTMMKSDTRYVCLIAERERTANAHSPQQPIRMLRYLLWQIEVKIKQQRLFSICNIFSCNIQQQKQRDAKQ